MASEKGIVGVWGLLQAAGIPRPWAKDDEARRGLAAWELVLRDIDDDRLTELTAAWLRSPDSRYGRWPTPGALLHAIPSVDLLDDADEAWGEVLGVIAWRGSAEAPRDPEALENLRSRLRASYELARENGNSDRMARCERIARSIPRADPDRDAAIYAGIQACGGWLAIGRAEDEQIAAHRASFRSAYRSHRTRNRLSSTEEKVIALLGDRTRMVKGQISGGP